MSLVCPNFCATSQGVTEALDSRYSLGLFGDVGEVIQVKVMNSVIF